jgi:selenide, water dikinase
MLQEKINLLDFTTNAGCSCKIPSNQLQTVLQSEYLVEDKNLLVSNTTSDDAAVYQINDTTAIISTTDFFTPIHNDAFTYGAIAAANAVSDIYAMGGTPIMATAILAWPVDKLSATLAQQVMEGAQSICKQIGIAIAGGHSVMAPEPLFGLNVTGSINPQNIKYNNKANIGDLLYLTKPLGLGMLTSAQKRSQLQPEHEAIAEKIMCSINSFGAIAGQQSYVTAITDITGFGLAGHIIEMCDQHRVSIDLQWQQLPIIQGLDYYIKNNIKPDATFRNWQSYSSQIGFSKAVSVMDAFSILPDPQTSGGLCIAIQPEAKVAFEQLLTKYELTNFTQPIGVFTAASEKVINVI